MRRREFIALLGGAAAWPLDARAQQSAMPLIGYLHFASPGPFGYQVVAFHRGLSETGYVEGRNVAIEYRWGEGRYDRLPALAADLVARRVDVIASVGPPSARAAKNATSTIPIVFMVGTDPVADGLVDNLARPGGNLTGISLLAIDLTPKRLELISELVPQAKVIALLVNPSSANPWIGHAQDAARTRGVELPILKASTEGEIDAAFATLAELRTEALIIGDDAFFTSRREQIVALTSAYAIPAIERWREFPASGGLISYGPSLTVGMRHLGGYAGKVLKGAKPADLPVEQPTEFELVINLKTAKTLGLHVPSTLLATASEVIE